MLLMSTEESVSAFINAIIAVFNSAALHMPDPDNNFNDFIKDDFIKFLVFSAV